LSVSSPSLVARLTDPALTARLSHFVRGRVPESDVDDIVQATIADALDAEEHPEGDEDLVRWLFGICRHKLVDWFRRMRREVPLDLEADEENAPAASVPTSALDLARWARRELPKGKHNEQTLEWMLREGEGEKLEAIAAEANLPPPAVRQRVSRLRKYYRKRWAAQAAALAALLLVAIAVAFALRRKPEQVAPRPDPSLRPPAPFEPPAPVAPPPAPSSVPAASSEPDAAPAPPASAPVPAPTSPPRRTAPRPHSTVAPPTKAAPRKVPSVDSIDSTSSTPPAPAAPASSSGSP
jgi:DNA-directed RNA polymerase specialized sigma24 family protein